MPAYPEHTGKHAASRHLSEAKTIIPKSMQHLVHPAEPAYPSAGVFELKYRSVRAMQYDGTRAGAYEILAWVLRHGGEGTLTDEGAELWGAGLLFINSTHVGPVETESWVLYSGNKHFEVLSDEDFREKYEPVTS